MEQLSSHFFKMGNNIFSYGLSSAQFIVYSYLVCRAGQRDVCWPSVGTIAHRCRMSETTVRKVISALEEQGFIRKVYTKHTDEKGRTRQGNNYYYILRLPPLPAAQTGTHPAGPSALPAYREVAQEGGGASEVL